MDEDADGEEEEGEGYAEDNEEARPSLPVLFALSPPIGNWLTSGDHVKNLLLFVFYLHQLVEVPWNSYLTAPSLYTSTSITHPPDAQTVVEHDARTADQARVRALARSAPSSSSSSSSSSSAHSFTSSPAPPVHPNTASGNAVQMTSPISSFSTALLALLTALRPLLDLVARVSAHPLLYLETLPIPVFLDDLELIYIRGLDSVVRDFFGLRDAIEDQYIIILRFQRTSKLLADMASESDPLIWSFVR
ncbi:hypothetical protein B0H11DRAFT_2354444 [Mycena galericulata]|nr:hypothetical protein B0H11DRAFT_2354444 [Mycena galericulata]